MYTMMLIHILILGFCTIHFVYSSHFRGGTISWKVLYDSTVEFKFKMGWTYGSGPGCTMRKLGIYVDDTFIGDKFWKCVSGCTDKVNVGSVYYYCTAASTLEDWEQGENTFKYTFKDNGKLTIRLQYGCYHEMKIPMYDPDGDTVRCRWARGQECDSICKAVPSAELDEDSCTLKFNASQAYNYTDDGWYGITLTSHNMETLKQVGVNSCQVLT